MQESTRTSQSWNGRIVAVTPIKPADRAKKITDAIGRRAFQISEARNFAPGHEREDWQRAESEVVGPFCGGWTLPDNSIVVTGTASLYKEGAIEVCIEPRRLTIFGVQRASLGHDALEECRHSPEEKEIVRILDLPVEVDPAGATARFNHAMLEIAVPQLQSARAVGGGSRGA